MKKTIKITAITLASILGCILLLGVVYILYVVFQFYRIDDKISVDISNNQESSVEVGEEYVATTFNIGFGAYNHEFDFFFDSGEMKTGEKVNGKGSRAKNKEIAIENVNGCINALEDASADFMFFQEVDTAATRSYQVNQYNMILEKYKNYGATFAENFHSAYLLLPFPSFHGATKAGIATLSRYNLSSSVRRSFPVDMSFPYRFTDLDRCFMLSRVPVASGGELVMINVHMSAYDEGGKIRAQQLVMLNEVLKEEKDKGNYVVVGGDFNHDIANSKELFETTQKVPSWVNTFTNENLTDGYKIAAATNAATCRSTDMPYKKGENFSVVVDGFLVSDNVEVVNVTNMDLDFKNSDHNPVKLTFKLSGK